MTAPVCALLLAALWAVFLCPAEASLRPLDTKGDCRAGVIGRGAHSIMVALPIGPNTKVLAIGRLLVRRSNWRCL
jgi:hypothetical protein